MSTRERKRDDIQHEASAPQPGGPEQNHFDGLQRHARDLLDTARHLIDNTLSGESEDYLDAVRQQGGQ
jgi:hypothetical protein